MQRIIFAIFVQESVIKKNILKLKIILSLNYFLDTSETIKNLKIDFKSFVREILPAARAQSLMNDLF